MTDILVDVHRLDGVLQTKGHVNGYDEENALYYEAILANHGTTQAQFDSSMVWYAAHPKRFQLVYPNVISRLEAEKEPIAAYNQRLRELKNYIRMNNIPAFSLDSLRHIYSIDNQTYIYHLPQETVKATVPFLPDE